MWPPFPSITEIIHLLIGRHQYRPILTRGQKVRHCWGVVGAASIHPWALPTYSLIRSGDTAVHDNSGISASVKNFSFFLLLLLVMWLGIILHKMKFGFSKTNEITCSSKTPRPECMSLLLFDLASRLVVVYVD